MEQQDRDIVRELLEMEADSVVSRPVSFSFEAREKSMIPREANVDKIVITPLTVGTVFRITPLLLKIDPKDLEHMVSNKNRDFTPETPQMFAKYGPLVLDIICIGIHNKKSSYPNWFKEFLQENTEWKDLQVLLNAILFRMGNSSFYASTTMLEKVGPYGAKEIIALAKNLKSGQKKTP